MIRRNRTGTSRTESPGARVRRHIRQAREDLEWAARSGPVEVRMMTEQERAERGIPAPQDGGADSLPA
jgi:hypothetical protein